MILKTGKRIENLEQSMHDEEQHEGPLMLSDSFARLMYESKTINRVCGGDEPYSPKVEQILQEQCQSLGLDYEAMSKELQQALACEDYLLYTDMAPWAQLLALLSKKRLGPSGQALFEALDKKHELTEDQEENLEKICESCGHPEWLEPILKEIEEFNQALAQVDTESSQSQPSYGSGVHLMDKSQLY